VRTRFDFFLGLEAAPDPCAEVPSASRRIAELPWT
jgi:hypothetical protein